MPCIFCIAAIAIIASAIVPALVDSMGAQLRTASKDLRKVIDTDETVMWSGTFSFTGADRRTKTAGANVTIYKASKRARIQAATHDLSREDAAALQDTIAKLLGATIVSRHDGREPGLPASALDSERPQKVSEQGRGGIQVDSGEDSSRRTPAV